MTIAFRPRYVDERLASTSDLASLPPGHESGWLSTRGHHEAIDVSVSLLTGCRFPSFATSFLCLKLRPSAACAAGKAPPGNDC